MCVLALFLDCLDSHSVGIVFAILCASGSCLSAMKRLLGLAQAASKASWSTAAATVCAATLGVGTISYLATFKVRLRTHLKSIAHLQWAALQLKQCPSDSLQLKIPFVS